jgi:pimeloyl-ACP methyl ester carboxylesterase
LVYDDQGFALAEDGTRLFYGVRGAAGDGGRPAIILNDGIGCDGFAWKYVQPDLANDHRVVHWHYRGHGRSGPPIDKARVDIPALARDLLSVLTHLSIERAVLFGHSMGTQVALEAYRLAPDRVAGMVLLCGSYGRVTETFHGTDVLKNVLPTLIEQVQSHRSLARALWGRISPWLAFRVARMSREVDALNIREEDFHPYWEHINLIDPDVFLPMLRLAGEHSAEDLLGSIRVPVLVIAAERDTFTPPELAQSMADRIPESDFMIVAGGSHAAPIEQPEPILARIRAFLAERVEV